MRGSRNFYPRGSNCDNGFFSSSLVDEGTKDPNTTLAVHHRAASENPFAFRWRADDGPPFNAGLVVL